MIYIFQDKIEEKKLKKGSGYTNWWQMLGRGSYEFVLCLRKKSYKIGETGHVTVRHVRLMVADNNCKKGQV